jgi:hypothetical protein
MLIKILQYVLGFGPFLLLLWYLAISRSLNLSKGVAAGAIYLGSAFAYTHYQGTGLFGMILALTGLIAYLEEIRKDHFREMLRLSEEPAPVIIPESDAVPPDSE